MFRIGRPGSCVTLSVCKEGYEQASMPAPQRPRTVSSHALLDTGAQMVVIGIDLVHRLGVTKREMFPVTSGIKAANSEGLRLIRGLLVAISAI